MERLMLTLSNTRFRIIRFKQKHLVRHLVCQIPPLMAWVVKDLEALGRMRMVDGIPDYQIIVDVDSAAV